MSAVLFYQPGVDVQFFCISLLNFKVISSPEKKKNFTQVPFQGLTSTKGLISIRKSVIHCQK